MVRPEKGVERGCKIIDIAGLPGKAGELVSGDHDGGGVAGAVCHGVTCYGPLEDLCPFLVGCSLVQDVSSVSFAVRDDPYPGPVGWSRLVRFKRHKMDLLAAVVEYQIAVLRGLDLYVDSVSHRLIGVSEKADGALSR